MISPVERTRCWGLLGAESRKLKASIHGCAEWSLEHWSRSTNDVQSAPRCRRWKNKTWRLSVGWHLICKLTYAWEKPVVISQKRASCYTWEEKLEKGIFTLPFIRKLSLWDILVTRIDIKEVNILLSFIVKFFSLYWNKQFADTSSQVIKTWPGKKD